MATVTGITAAKARDIENASITSGRLSGKNLILRTHGGTDITVGEVKATPIDAWPVGSIFMNTASTNPATLLGGGIWSRWGKGRVPVSIDEGQTEFNTSQEVAGSKTHSLTTAQMPAHSHTISSTTQSHSHTINVAAGGVHNHTATVAAAGDHVHAYSGDDPAGRATTYTYKTDQGAATAQISYKTTPYTKSVDTLGAKHGPSGVGTHTHTATIANSSSHTHTATATSTSASHSHTSATMGSSSSFPILQPYITVYMWRRTA